MTKKKKKKARFIPPEVDGTDADSITDEELERMMGEVGGVPDKDAASTTGPARRVTKDEARHTKFLALVSSQLQRRLEQDGLEVTQVMRDTPLHEIIAGASDVKPDIVVLYRDPRYNTSGIALLEATRSKNPAKKAADESKLAGLRIFCKSRGVAQVRCFTAWPQKGGEAYIAEH